MTMTPTIDGGGILAHFFPYIVPEDTPGSLFMKSIIGCVNLYDRFLSHLKSGGCYLSIEQCKPSSTHADTIMNCVVIFASGGMCSNASQRFCSS